MTRGGGYWRTTARRRRTSRRVSASFGGVFVRTFVETSGDAKSLTTPTRSFVRRGRILILARVPRVRAPTRTSSRSATTTRVSRRSLGPPSTSSTGAPTSTVSRPRRSTRLRPIIPGRLSRSQLSVAPSPGVRRRRGAPRCIHGRRFRIRAPSTRRPTSRSNGSEVGSLGERVSSPSSLLTGRLSVGHGA